MTELKNIYEERPCEEVVAELMSIENMIGGL